MSLRLWFSLKLHMTPTRCDELIVDQRLKRARF